MEWRGMRAADLVRVGMIAEEVHPGLPEALTVPAERLALCPEGCLVLEGAAGVVGYVVSHPWHAGAAPKLDSLLSALPAIPGCWYWHDLAVLPAARGLGAAAAAVGRVLAVARAAGLDQVALVAVGESAGFWRRMGFAPAAGPAVASYGAGAAYMVRAV
jgi:GNAT superfamily N-acetyltransferase